MDASRIRQKISLLRGQRAKLEKLASSPTEMMDGYWTVRYIKCGKPERRCADSDGHGPYYYISRSKSGNTQLEYVKGERLKKERLCKKWQQYNRWISDISKYNRQIESLYRRLAKTQIKKRKKNKD